MGAKRDHAKRAGLIAAKPCTECDRYMCECEYDCGKWDEEYANRLSSGEMDD